MAPTDSTGYYFIIHWEEESDEESDEEILHLEFDINTNLDEDIMENESDLDEMEVEESIIGESLDTPKTHWSVYDLEMGNIKVCRILNLSNVRRRLFDSEDDDEEDEDISGTCNKLFDEED